MQGNLDTKSVELHPLASSGSVTVRGSDVKESQRMQFADRGSRELRGGVRSVQWGGGGVNGEESQKLSKGVSEHLGSNIPHQCPNMSH
jgi:hypothetical protein